MSTRKSGKYDRRNSHNHNFNSRDDDDHWTVRPPLDQPQRPNIIQSQQMPEVDVGLTSTSASASTSISSDHNNFSNVNTAKATAFVSNTSSKKKYNQRISKRQYGDRGNKAARPIFMPKSEVVSSNSGRASEEEEDSDGKIKGNVQEDAVEATTVKGKSYSSGKNSECSVKSTQDVVKDERTDGDRIDCSEESIQTADDVFSRLEKLQLGIEDVDLSEEQMRMNDQAQEDELLVLESIYGENLYILDRWRGLRSFQVHVHIELPNEFTVSTKLGASGDPGQRNGEPDGFSYSFKVQYIPPILLTCLLPRSYPSHSAPSFTLSVQWLNSAKISNLCSLLDTMWNEQPGQEILYQWVEWLHSSSLSYLGFEEEVVLGPYGVKLNADKRAFSGVVSPDVDIPSIKSYNDERRHETFLFDVHECGICFSEYSGIEFIRLPCQHFFCKTCMKTYVGTHVKEGTVNKIHCPVPKCGGMFPPGLLKRLLGDGEYQRWESFMLQKTLDAMSDVAYCPRCETACIEDDSQEAQCSNCLFSFCTLCRERRHVGQECMTPEAKLRVLQERQNSAHLKDAQKLKEREMINEMMSVAEIMRDSKLCPHCKMAISKTEGCNKMVCGNCGKYFCYSCGKQIDGYDHFRDEKCVLFTMEVIQQWEAQMNGRQVEGQIRAQLFPGRARPCPNCRQLNAKVGNNNHIFCWACQGHYCYLCRKVVRRSSQHYGPKGCKQHSAD